MDVGIYEAVLALMESTIPEYDLAGAVRGRTGTVLPFVAPSNIYPTKDDDYVLIAANADNVFKRLSEALDKPGWPEEERYATHQARGENMEELDAKISEWTRERSGEEILDLMEEHGVPAGKVFTAEDMLEDPHYAARENVIRVEDPDIGPFPMQNVVPRLTETPGKVRRTGPKLGEHNEEVYGGLLKLDEDERGRLEEQGII